jgi:hypothetical protein
MPKVANSTGGFRSLKDRVCQLEFINQTQAEIINAQRVELLQLRMKNQSKFSTEKCEPVSTNKVIHNRNLEGESA